MVVLFHATEANTETLSRNVQPTGTLSGGCAELLRQRHTKENDMANTKEATDYEGWTNRATWNVSLWLNNDEGSYRSMIEFAKKYDGKMTAGKARYFGMQTFGDRTPDNCRLGTVNWSEIADMMNEAVAS